MVLSIHAENASNLTNRYLGMFLEGKVDRQTDRQTDRLVHRRPTPKQYPSDFIGGKPVLSTGYLVSCSRTQRSASGEARTRNPSILGQALYHDCAPKLWSILCRYDTCPTQYAPDLRGSILCMQGTQYAPRESILCMEHFVALQRTNRQKHCSLWLCHAIAVFIHGLTDKSDIVVEFDSERCFFLLWLPNFRKILHV